MKNYLLYYLLITLSIIVNSCNEGFEEEYLKISLALKEVTAITTPTSDTTPDYTFSSTESGTITYGGSCSSSTASATSGSNTVTLNSLSNGTYADCTITVSKTISTKNSETNLSDSLTITSFTVDNTTISSSASDNATVTFGQTYQYQLTTSGTFPGTITYSLSNEPDNMTISSSGLVEWTPSKASQITTHTNITITLTTASGYVLTETYDLTVTGTCVSGNVMAIWSGDQRSSTDSSKLLVGNVTAYTDNSSSVKTATQNYGYISPSEHLTHGPTLSATTGNVFFYNQYDNTTHTYLFFMFGKTGAAFSNPNTNTVNLDFFADNNTSTDAVVVADDTSGEIGKQSSGCGSSDTCYKGRLGYGSGKSDGGVIGPFSGTSYRIFVDLGGTSTIDDSTALTLGNLDSFNYYSKDGTSFALGAVDNFTVGFTTTLDCSN
jgi:hypothetical protein